MERIRGLLEEVRERAAVYQKRKNANALFHKTVEAYATGADIDDCMRVLLHKSSYFRGAIYRKAWAFLNANTDYAYGLHPRSCVDDIATELSLVVYELLRDGTSIFADIQSYVAVFDLRTNNRIRDLKRRFLAQKNEVHRKTRPRDAESIELLKLLAETNGNFKSTIGAADAEEDDDGMPASNRKPLYPEYKRMNDVENRLLVAQMLGEKILTEQERLLLRTKYVQPDATLAELAEACGYKGKMAVQRAFRSISNKLTDYR